MKKTILILLLLPIVASSQSFNVFDIDVSEYPIMKAKFYSIDENGDQILNHTTSDFEILSNSQSSEVLSVSCPEPTQEDEIYSIAMSIDFSGSMRGEPIELGKYTAKEILNVLSKSQIKFALQQCNNKASILNDYTKDYEKVIDNIDKVRAGGGNDFVEQLLNPNTGLLNIATKGEGSRIAVIYTDAYWHPLDPFKLQQAIEICNNNDIRVFSIIYTTPKAEPDGIKASLRELSEKSGGEFYDGVTNADLASITAIRTTEKVGYPPCEITWRVNPDCKKYISLNLLNKTNKKRFASQLILDDSELVSFEFENRIVDFGEESSDTIITLTSRNISQTISGIRFEPDFGYFKILTPLPITFNNNETKEIELRFTNNSVEREYSEMIIETEFCENSITLLTGDKNLPVSNKQIKLTHPNGGEVFSAGSDTLITWKGIPHNEKVQLNFSDNNGKDWSTIPSTNINSKSEWDVPIIVSDSCLISIHYYGTNKDDNSFDMEVEWQKTYGGTEIEETRELLGTYDGGFALSGSTESNNFDFDINDFGRKAFISKLDSTGDLQWLKVYGDKFRNSLESISNTTDSGFVFVGTVQENQDSDLNMWIVKTDSLGELEWEKYYGGTSDDVGLSIKQTSDGGFIICGSSNSIDGDLSTSGNKGKEDIWVMKLDASGNEVWNKTFGGTGDEYASSIIQTNSGEYALTGVSYSKDWGFGLNQLSEEDIFVIKLNAQGNEVWKKIYGGYSDDYANSIIEAINGNFYVAGGFRDVNGGGINANLLNINRNGNQIRSYNYGGSLYDVLTSINILDNGEIILAGYSSSINGDLEELGVKGDNDFWVLKIDVKGKILWSKAIGGSKDDRAYSILKMNNNEFAVSGITSSIDKDLSENSTIGSFDSWIVKFRETQPLQSDTSDAVFSIIMPEPMIQNNDIDMGEMIVGNTKDTVVSSVICNTGDAPLHVLGVDIIGGDADDFLIPRGAGDFYLEKDECQDIMIEFTPSRAAKRTTWATIRTTIGDYVDTISITGRGIAPLVEATSDVVDFGQFELGQGKDTSLVLIKNVGADDITITETKITGPDTEQFDMTPLPSFTLTAGDEQELELNYTAKYGGRTSSIIEFHYDGVGSPLRSMLFAEGIGGEVYPQVPDAYVGERVELGLHLGRIKPEGLDEVATNFTATVSYNSTLLAPIDKSMTVTTENTTSFIEIEGQLSGVSQIATVPMKVGLGTAVSSGLVVTEFQLYNANGDSVDYEIEPGVGEFNVLGICEEGGTRLVNPNGKKVELKVTQDQMNTNATVSMNLIESGQTDLIIYDQLGNAVETAYSGTPSTGTKELNIDLSNYANGRYYIKLVTPTVTKTEIIEVVR